MNDETRQLIQKLRTLEDRVAQLEAANLSLSAADVVALVDGASPTWSNDQIFAAGLGVGVAGSLLQRPAAGVVRQALETTTIANGATLAVSSVNTGFVFINNASDGAPAIIQVAGAGGTILHGSTSVFSGTAGTASRMNVYATGGRVTVQNNLGATKTIQVFVLL